MTEENIPKFLPDLFPPNLTKREQDAIKVQFIKKFGGRQWSALIGRTASKAKQ
jgi:hypothetical protein